MTFLLILALHASRHPAQSATWPTLRRLQHSAEQLGLASRNGVESMVGYFHQYGLIERRPVADDRRLSVITPTTKMLALHTEFVDAHRAPLALLGHGHTTAILADELDPCIAGRPASTELLRELATMRRRHPLMRRFVARDGGYLLLLLLMRAVPGDDRHVVMPYGVLAEFIGTSRTQVRLLIEEAEGEGLLTLRAPGGRHIALQPLLWETVDRWFAEHMSFFGKLAAQVAEASRALESPPDAGRAVIRPSLPGTAAPRNRD